MSVFVHENATVEKGAELGDGTKIWHYAHIRDGAVLGKNCNVGHCGFVDSGAKIGNNVRIGNKVSIFQGVEIGDDVFVGPHVVFTNDMRPRFRDDWKIFKTRVKKGASIGSNTTIICGIEIGSYSLIGAGSVVTRDVPDHALVYGNPARIRGFVCECGEDLAASGKDGDAVVMKCTKCGKTVKVPKNIYGKV